MPDPETAQVLDDARSQAAAGLKGRFPDSMLAPPPPAAPKVSNSVRNDMPGAAPAPVMPAPEPGPDAIPIHDSTPPEPGPAAVPVKDENTVGRALGESTKQLGSEFGNGLMRAAATTARSLGFAGATLAGSDFSGEGNPSSPSEREETGAQSQAAVFDAIKNHVDTAIDHWRADPNNTNAWAGTLGDVTSGVAPMMLGPGGVPAVVANAASTAGKESVDRGEDVKTAAYIATLAGVGTALQMKIAPKDPNIVKRIAKWVGAGDLINVATDALTKHVLNNAGYKEAAANIDPLDPKGLGVNTLMQTIFGILHAPEAVKAAPKPKPTAPDLAVGAGEPPVPPEPTPGSVPVGGSGSAQGALPSTAAWAKPTAETPPPPVADKPTAEPPSDLRAQVAEMKDPASDRSHVYLSKANVDNLGGMAEVKKLAGGAVVTLNFDRAGGTLLSANHSVRSKATALRKKNGDDMQATLGALTGAGDGKTPDKTAVVQGQTPEGAVVKEASVAPAEVPAAVEAVKAAGHEPVVTTPDDAVARRAALVEHEGSIPAEPSEQAKPVTEAAPDEPQALKQGDRKTINIGGEDVPVLVDGPAVDNKVPVRTIDDEGRISKDVRNVPAEMFKKGTIEPKAGTEPLDMSKTKEERAAERERVAAQRDAEDGKTREVEPEPIPKNAAEREGEAARRDAATDSQAQAVLDRFTASEAIPPGKSFPSSITDRASSLSETARAIKELTKQPGIDSQVAADATETANKVSRLDLKSTESMAHGRGVSHKAMDIHAAELKRVLGNLIGGTPKFAEQPVQVKAEKLKLKIAKERAAAAEPPKPTVGDKIKAKQAAAAVERAKVKTAIPDVRDETKPPEQKKLNGGEKAKIAAALDRYNRVGDLDTSTAHDNLERVLHDVYGPQGADFANNILALAREQRADARSAERPKRMSDTVDEDELKGHDYDPAEHEPRQEDNYGDAHESREENAALAAASPIGKLHAALDGTGFWKKLSDLRDSGGFASTHKTLDHLIRVSKENGNEPMHTLLSKLREHVPDLPIRPVEKVIDPETGRELAGSAGVFHSKASAIQVRIPAESGILDSAQFARTHALVHEIVHGATSYELHANPTGVFAKQVQELLQEARRRASAMPVEVGKNHYGLKDAHEFLAEALTNPVFQKFLAESESVAKGYKRQFNNLTDIFERLARSVAKLLGYKGNPKLLRDTMLLAQHGMERQSRWMANDIASSKILRDMPTAMRDRLINQDRASAPDHMPGLNDALDNLHHLEEPPPDLQHEDEFRGVVGSHLTDTAKLFRRAVRSGAVETIRRSVRALTPYDGLVRSALRRGVFGHNDATNPLRHYDDLIQQRDAVVNRMAHSAEPIVNDRAKLSYTDSKKLGQFQDDIGSHGFAIEDAKADQPKRAQQDKKFDAKWKEMQDRWANLTDAQRDIYRRERDWNESAIRANRKAGVDVVVDSYSDQELPKAKRALLYSVSNPHDFEHIIGTGKEIDVGADRNDKLIDALKDMSSTSEIEGDYFHKGRHGDHVVQITPEGTKTYSSEAAAQVYAEKVRALSPGSRAKVEKIGDNWQVDYKAQYVSMHNSPAEADAEVERLRGQGHDVGSVTQKVLSETNAPLSLGMQDIVAEASRRLGDDEAGKALKESLRNAFVARMAARSAYAGSKLARKNVGGVKPEEMGRNFATHAQSLSWNTGHLATVFKVGEALGKLREATRDSSQPQARASQRGRVYDEVQRRLTQEVQQYGSHVPFNAAVAKLGFMNYMFSVSHALIYLTQNFTTAIPSAGARFGYAKATSTFAHSMSMISGPAFRETYRAVLGTKGHNVDSIQHAILEAVKGDKRFGKWAVGGKDSPLQQLIDRGIIHTSLSNQMAVMAKGGNRYVNRVMEWSRILPSMADIFNRVSTGVAALELHKGDVYRAGDFVKETHVDYSQNNKPRAFRAVGRIWGGNSVTMFKSYMTSMAHLLYSHVYDAVSGEAEGGRSEALKVVAGMMVGNALFSGVQRGLGLEPMRALVYAYNKLVGDNDEYHSFDNMTRRAVSALAGGGKTAEVINGGLPRAFGFDMSSRMGLSDLILHDPPDLLSMDAGDFAKFGFAQLGPIAQELAQNVGSFNTAMTTGRMDEIPGMLPIKLVHNVLDAYKAGTTGKVSSSGAQLTQPSAGAAISHLIGFRTAEEARVAEKSATITDYKSFANNKKYALVKAYAKLDPSERGQFWKEQIVPWNKDNPGHKIAFGDLRKQMRGILNTERAAQGLPGRDPVQNELLDYE